MEFLSCSEDGKIVLWNLGDTNPKLIMTEKNLESVSMVAIIKYNKKYKGKIVSVSGMGQFEKYIVIWNPFDGSLEEKIDTKISSGIMLFVEIDKDRFCVPSGTKLCLFSFATKKVVVASKENICDDLVFHMVEIDGKKNRYAVSGRSISIIVITKDSQFITLQKLEHEDAVPKLSYCAKSRSLVSCSFDSTIVVWKESKGKFEKLATINVEVGDIVRGIDLSFDVKGNPILIYGSSRQSSVHFNSLEDGKWIQTLLTENCACLQKGDTISCISSIPNTMDFLVGYSKGGIRLVRNIGTSGKDHYVVEDSKYDFHDNFLSYFCFVECDKNSEKKDFRLVIWTKFCRGTVNFGDLVVRTLSKSCKE